jgi:hypothetical protein
MADKQRRPFHTREATPNADSVTATTSAAALPTAHGTANTQPPDQSETKVETPDVAAPELINATEKPAPANDNISTDQLPASATE